MTLDSILWIGAAMGEASVLSLVVYKRLWKSLPIFSIYVAWTLASDIAYYIIQHYLPAITLLAYTVETTVDALFQFSVLVELGWSVLRPVRASLPRSSVYILTLLVAVAGLLIWPIAGMTIPNNLLPNTVLLFHLAQTFAILRVVCFLVMASFSQLLAIGWRDRELQVATGLGIYSIISLIVAVLQTHHMTVPQFQLLDRIVTVGYFCTLSYWIFSFAAKEQERREFSPQMQQVLLLMGGGVHAGKVALTDLSAQSRRQKDK